MEPDQDEHDRILEQQVQEFEKVLQSAEETMPWLRELQRKTEEAITSISKTLEGSNSEYAEAAVSHLKQSHELLNESAEFLQNVANEAEIMLHLRDSKRE